MKLLTTFLIDRDTIPAMGGSAPLVYYHFWRTKYKEDFQGIKDN